MMTKKPKLSELTLREKIAQTAMLSQMYVFDRFTQSDGAVKYVAENPIGTFHAQGASNFGEIHMVDGVAQGFKEKDYTERYHKWVIDFQKVSKVPLLVASDCESGMGWAFPQMDTFQSANTFGATDSEEYSYKKGYLIAAEAKYAGVNWLWGPPADLSARNFVVMTGRNYGDDIELNKRLAVAEIKGMQDAGVAATLKHFPGPGTVDYRDPHASPSVNPISLEEWEKTQGAIYQAAIDAGVYSVMIGHTAFPAVDNTKIGQVYAPSTLSSKVIIDLLKNKMGFKGVVVTDGVGMRALSIMFRNVDDLHRELIKAGNDVILSIRDIERYTNVIEEAVKTGYIPESRIDDACQRVLDMKEKLGLFTDKEETVKPYDTSLNEQAKVLREEVARDSVTLVCDRANHIPLNKDKIKKVCVIAPGYDNGVYERVKEVFTREFKARGVEEIEVRHQLVDGGKQFEEEDLIPVAEHFDLIIYAAHMAGGTGPLYMGDSFRTLAFSLRHGAEKSICMSTGSPFLYFDYFCQADTYFNLYDAKEEQLVAVVQAMYGEIECKGKSFFNLVPEFGEFNW